VIVLSNFAGAAYELNTAEIVNPYDPDAVAEALQTALGMPLGERLRWEATMTSLRGESSSRRQPLTGGRLERGISAAGLDILVLQQFTPVHR